MTDIPALDTRTGSQKLVSKHTEDIILSRIQNDPHCFATIFLQTEATCLAAIRASMKNLAFVYKRDIPQEFLVDLIVEKEERLVDLQSVSSVDSGFYKALVSTKPELIKWLSVELLAANNSIMLIAISNNPATFPLIPQEALTSQVCLYAVQQSNNLLEHVPQRFQTKDFLYEVKVTAQ